MLNTLVVAIAGYFFRWHFSTLPLLKTSLLQEIVDATEPMSVISHEILIITKFQQLNRCSVQRQPFKWGFLSVTLHSSCSVFQQVHSIIQ